MPVPPCLVRSGAGGAGEAVEDGGGHEGGDDGHDGEDGEEFLGDDAVLEADIDDDEFHETACVHEDADAEGFAVGDTGGAGGGPAGEAFSGDGGGEDGEAHEPEVGGVETADAGIEA